MLEKMCGIKSSKVVLNCCLYMLCVVPGYIFLYEKFKLGFWTILIIETIVNYTLLSCEDIWDLIVSEIDMKNKVLLGISIVALIIMLGVCLVRYSIVFWTLMITEGLGYLLFKLKEVLRQ